MPPYSAGTDLTTTRMRSLRHQIYPRYRSAKSRVSLAVLTTASPRFHRRRTVNVANHDVLMVQVLQKKQNKTEPDWTPFCFVFTQQF